MIDGDFNMTAVTQLRLSFSLFMRGLLSNCFFPIGIQWSLVPPADKRGIRFLYRSVRLHFAFLGLEGCVPIRLSDSVGVSFLALPNTIKFWAKFFMIIWLVSILPNYARVFQSLITDVSPKIWPKYGYDISYFAGLTRQKLLSVWIWSFAGLFDLFSSGSNMQLSSSSGWYE